MGFDVIVVHLPLQKTEVENKKTIEYKMFRSYCLYSKINKNPGKKT